MSGINYVERNGKHFITYNENGAEAGFIEVTSNNKVINALHTEVKPEFSGKGIGKLLFNGFVDYAKSNGLKVKADCTFINSQLKRHHDELKEIIADEV